VTGSAFHRSRRVRGRSARAWLAAALLVAAASPAAADWTTLRWTHPDPSDVQNFRVHIGSRSGRYDRVLDVGKPSPDADGVFSYLVDLGDGDPVYVALTAIGHDGLESALSNERAIEQVSAGTLGQPGKPVLVGP
jgi:hypothetical protein